MAQQSDTYRSQQTIEYKSESNEQPLQEDLIDSKFKPVLAKNMAEIQLINMNAKNGETEKKID